MSEIAASACIGNGQRSSSEPVDQSRDTPGLPSQQAAADDTFHVAVIALGPIGWKAQTASASAS
ncbi:hypothetical protein PtA15_9A653 [Puccinia triticina]|uniref:Uncharacterized protein n=1 Tax=Puccinia triticina TaxID=208348 RepID=A0ABY7CWN2_9BASI|nr:uncharacterized protein PtA15_9A653 [Puccinia triticina]WAQ88526.1 hypothetical protein PtA15_9A653 [Puccinia triticina]WAR60707.1 hypothetical protein PtB15_9B646 [Puccinia triticina]